MVLLDILFVFAVEDCLALLGNMSRPPIRIFKKTRKPSRNILNGSSCSEKGT